MRPKVKRTACLLCACAALSSTVLGATLEHWQGQSLYQIITDRFFDGDPTNNNLEGRFDPAGSKSVHGGDFKGLEQKLDYIQALGATAIWISPIVLNGHGEFHGYSGRDFYQVAPHWGTLADLQHLNQAAHARGMSVIADIVVNHGSTLVDSADPGYRARFKAPPDGYHLRYTTTNQYAPPFNTNAQNPTLEDLFHNNGLIHDYQVRAQVELGELSGLDDFRTESPYVQSNMVAVYQYWIEQAGFDGFRVDTVKHVEMGFWQYWCPRIHAFAAAHGKPDFLLFGEVYDGSVPKCASYTDRVAGGEFLLDSVVDYPLYFKVNRVFARPRSGTRPVEDHYAAVDSAFAAPTRNALVTFLDNHDQPRFLSPENANNDWARLRTALVFLYTARGIPCLYYGTEQGFNGANDPDDREDMFAGRFEQGPSRGDNFNEMHPLFQWVARLNNFRRLYPALTQGSHRNLWSEPSAPGVLAYARRQGGQELIVVLNTAATPRTLPARRTIYPAGTELVDLLDPAKTLRVAVEQRTPPIDVPAQGARLLIARDQALPLDPVISEATPPHDAANVSCTGPITLHFSQPMDAKTVEGAFALAPATRGAFTWSSAQNVLTFTPEVPGLPAHTLVTVTVARTAVTRTGQVFHSPFEMRFQTGEK